MLRTLVREMLIYTFTLYLLKQWGFARIGAGTRGGKAPSLRWATSSREGCAIPALPAPLGCLPFNALSLATPPLHCSWASRLRRRRSPSARAKPGLAEEPSVRRHGGRGPASRFLSIGPPALRARSNSDKFISPPPDWLPPPAEP